MAGKKAAGENSKKVAGKQIDGCRLVRQLLTA